MARRKARALFAQGRTADAARMMQRSAELRPEDYQAIGIVSMMLRKLGREEEAKVAIRAGFERVERWLQINPRDSRAWYFGALRLLNLGRRDEAHRWMERALNLAPDDPTVLYNAACFHSLDGAPERALDMPEKAARGGSRLGTSRDWLTNDPDLDPIRHLLRFQEILDSLA